MQTVAAPACEYRIISMRKQLHNQLSKGCLTLPGAVRFVYNDTSQDETYVSAVEAVVANKGKIDVFVNNFGTSNLAKDLDIEHADPEEFINTVNINQKTI
ncbi:SDR family oxidoreductase [Bifidobacterium catenulatum]|uniref:SDR family oxidoreductase n=1 Tax=Bifidobacterium sp. TaxID=41200 RepID=UPI00311A838B